MACKRRTPKKCKPIINCTLRTGTSRTFDYTIIGATTAWFVKTCYNTDGSTTNTTEYINPINNSFTAEPNCYYTLYAQGCGTVSTTCIHSSDCIPCGLSSGNFLYGVMVVENIPDIVTSACTAGRGWNGVTWSGFGDWNGVFVWTGDATVILELGIGHIDKFVDNDIRYGVLLSCTTTPRLIYCNSTDDLQLVQLSTSTVTPTWLQSYPSNTGTCGDGANPNTTQLRSYNTSDALVRYHEDCPVSSLGVIDYFPCHYGNYEFWFVTEFS